jgi:hypothetical protein
MQEGSESEEEEEEHEHVHHHAPKHAHHPAKPVKKAAAALSVGVGSLSDPWDLQVGAASCRAMGTARAPDNAQAAFLVPASSRAYGTPAVAMHIAQYVPLARNAG